jgi:hypothetical protein
VDCIKFRGFSGGAPTRRWLIAWLETASQARLRDFLVFVTGLSALPAARPGSWHIEVARAGDARRLPASSTCGRRLDLPEYESAGQLADKLQTALQERSFGFS